MRSRRVRRAISVVALLALMAAFGVGVNRLIASRKTNIHSETSSYVPTATRPAIILPGTLYLAQGGQLYRMSDGFFTSLHSSTSAGTWMQPAYVPGTQNVVAVLRSAEYSNLYLLNSQGKVIRQLSNNAVVASKVTHVWLNHWMFWPHFGPTGTLYFAYDQPKNSSTYAVDFSIWSGSLTGSLAKQQLTTANPFTGGDVDPTPMANGDVMFSRYSISNGNAFSFIALATKPLVQPVILSTGTQDCGQPAPSPDGTMVAMICIGGTGLQSTRLEVASLADTKLGTPRTLVTNCLCSAPVWAPDGSGLVYYNATDTAGHFELWWIKGALTAAPAAPLQVTTSLNFDATSPPSWSPLTSIPVMTR
jgi:Tol biopolymer transport system component